MRRTAGSLCVLLAVWIGLAGVAAGQQEQWLRYRTSAEPYRDMGRAWGKVQEPKADFPEGLALPKFNSDKPLFTEWWTPTVADEYLPVALDCSVKGGPYDLLYVDSDADGALADEKPIKATRVRNPMSRTYQYVDFKLVKLMLPGEDAPVACHMNVLYKDVNGKKRVVFFPGGWYEGPVTVGGQKLWCTLIDNNANGVFNDSAPNRRECDKIRIAQEGDTSFRNERTDRTMRFVGKYVEVAGKLYELHIPADGAYVKLSPSDKPLTGKIKVDEALSAFRVFGTMGHFISDPATGVIEVPAGEYVVDKYKVIRKDKYGARWQAREYRAAYEKTFVVEAGKQATLNIGEPFIVKANVAKAGNTYRINQKLETPSGDEILVSRIGSQPSPPKVRITNADGTYDRKFTMEYG